MEKNNLSQHESLEIIRQMISNSRQNLKTDSIFYLLWGWLVIIASLGHYLIWRFTDFQHPYLFWVILMPLGGIISFFLGRRAAVRDQNYTFIDKAMVYIWAGFTGPAIITITMGAVLGWKIIFPIFIMLYGWGAVASGGIIKFRPLVIGGLICFALAIAAIFTGPLNTLLLIALAITSSHLVPGYLLRKSNSK